MRCVSSSMTFNSSRPIVGASADSLVGSAGKSHAWVVFHGASVGGDSVFGVGSESAQRVAIADVRRAEERRFNSRRTAGVDGVVGLIALVLYGLAVSATPTGY